MQESINTYIKRQKVAKSAELEAVLGSRPKIQTKVEEGELFALGAGVYASPTIDPFKATVLAVARFFPQAVVSGFTALVIHGLSDEVLDKVDVDVEKSTSLRNVFLNVRRVAKKRLKGATSMPFLKEEIQIYDVERTLCDAYRLDPESPIFYKALKRYVKQYKPNTDKIAMYDKLLKTDVLNRLRQELANA